MLLFLYELFPFDQTFRFQFPEYNFPVADGTARKEKGKPRKVSLNFVDNLSPGLLSTEVGYVHSYVHSTAGAEPKCCLWVCRKYHYSPQIGRMVQ